MDLNPDLFALKWKVMSRNFILQSCNNECDYYDSKEILKVVFKLIV